MADARLAEGSHLLSHPGGQTASHCKLLGATSSGIILAEASGMA